MSPLWGAQVYSELGLRVQSLSGCDGDSQAFAGARPGWRGGGCSRPAPTPWRTACSPARWRRRWRAGAGVDRLSPQSWRGPWSTSITWSPPARCGRCAGWRSEVGPGPTRW